MSTSNANFLDTPIEFLKGVGPKKAEALQKELMKKMSKLKVYDVGNTVDLVKAGDIVLVDPSKITSAVVIPNLDLDVDIILISPFDVIHVW